MKELNMNDLSVNAPSVNYQNTTPTGNRDRVPGTESLMATVRPRRRFLQSMAGVAMGSAAIGHGGPVLAQEPWPNRPVRIVSGGAAGGGSDIFVRILEPRLRERLGQNVFIDNRPGAGGMVGAQVAATAPPDGYTFFVSNLATNGIGVSLYRKPTFDPKRDLPAVARISTLMNALAVRSDRGINTVAELLAHLKANPRDATFGSAGSGTSSHLAGVMFGQRTGLALTHVPYKGTAPNIMALLGGEIFFSLDNVPIYSPHVRAGKVKLLAVSSAQRHSAYPEVPTLQEAGVTPFDVNSWYGMSAATGTPRPVIERMSAEIIAALNDPAIAAKIREIGAEAAPLGPAEYGAFIEAEVLKWAPVVAASGAVVE